MSSNKSHHNKPRLHPRNRNKERYDLDALKISIPELVDYIKLNRYRFESIDFSNPIAVKLLNKGLLKYYYGIEFWDFPDANLCPPIPGRADYIHHIADLLGENNFGKIPVGNKITCFDIGVGASCIYPIIGVTEYDWNFIGSDIDLKSIESAKNIVDSNKPLNGKIELFHQNNSNNIFQGIFNKKGKIDISICNPPFHSSIKNAEKGTRRKIKNLTGKKEKNPTLNFSGNLSELICEGGENGFIHKTIKESEQFSKQCLWFSTLVSKQSNLKGIYNLLKNTNAKLVKTIPMGTGNKSTRIVAWTFHNINERNEWRESKWKK